MSQIKYQAEIEEMLSSIFRESWMNDEDWNEFKQFMIETVPEFDIQHQSDQIEIGISNGYSLEFQIKILKTLFNGI